MADIESNVKVNIDTSDALTQLKLLQQQISAFQQAMRKAGADNALAARQMQQNLANSINATGKFQANVQTIQTSAERFTTSLEKNKLSMGEYFRYAGGASKTFGKLFKEEFNTINQVARERVKELQTQYIKLGRDANGAMKAISVKPLALDMENLGTKTQMAAQRQQLFNQLMKQGSTNLLNFGKNTQWAGRQLMVGFTVPLVMMGSAAAKAYTEIEKASIAFKRVYGDINTTANETEKMVVNVRALATEFTKYGVAVADTMDMAAKAAAMGKTGADLLAQISQANKLSVLGQVDQQQALDTTISLTNAFGIATDELAGKIDFLNAVENQTVTSIEDLTIAIPKAAPVIQQLGGDVEDLTFFLTAMREGGINASEGANALKSGLASLINPSKKASDFMASFGISIKGIVEGNKGDVKGTVISMAKALDTLDPLNRARAIEQMFGKFQFSRISTLFKNVIDEGSQANKVAGLARETAQELAILSERELKKVSDSPLYKFQKSVEDMKSKLAPVGEAFLKAVTPVVELVGKILDGFNGLSDGAKQFASIATLAIAGIGPILLMTFGLIANGVANIMKMFVNLKSFFNRTGNKTNILGEQTSYMNTEQLRGAAIAASLDQAHAKLRQTFTSEAAAVDALTQAYKRAVTAQGAYAGIPGVPVGGAGVQRRKYANGVSMVPGPTGAGDIVPALLSPGEAVIPAKHARKYAPVIAGMVAGNLPGFESGTTGVGMRQSIIGPLTQKQTDGMARTALQLDEISRDVMAGPYGKVAPNNYGVQVSPSPGHSFPAFGVGGIYKKPDGTSVFVKPQMSLETALAEMRGTEIARSAHGLDAPKQKIGVMMDPTDPQNLRRFIVLESPVDEKFSNIPTKFTKNQYFKQLVASLLRGDKDLGLGNLGGNVLADVGPAGVFQRASGKRELGGKINSMEEQAIINLLGVKGGAKRFFAESTSDIAKKMKPEEYSAAIKSEIMAVMPKLQATIAGFGKLNPMEKKAYMDMQQRLQAGLAVDWGKYQAMHSAVPPKKYEDGTPGVGLKGMGGSNSSVAEAMRKMSQQQIREMLSIEDTHITTDLNTKDTKVLGQIKSVYPDITEEDLKYQSARSNLTAQLPASLNQRMRRGASGWRSPIFGNVWNGFRGKLSKIASMQGMEIPSLQLVEDEIGRKLATLPLANDETVGIEVKKILEDKLSPEKDPEGVYRQLWAQAQNVGTMRTDLKGPNGTMSETDALLSQLRLGVASWKQTGGGGYEIMNSSKTQRIGRFAIDQIAAGSGFTREQKDSFRLEARLAAERWIAAGNWNAPLPIVKSKPTAAGMYKIDPKTKLPRISKDTGKEMLGSGWKQLSLVGADTAAGKFSSRGRKKGGVGVIAYDDAFLKTAPQTSLGFAAGQEQRLYDTLMQNGGELVPPKQLMKWMALSSQTKQGIPKFADGTANVSQSAIAAFGAHQPFTSAHESIARMGMELAAKQGVPFRQFSTMQGKSKRSLLSDDLKSKLIRESIGISPDLTRDPFTLMETLSTQGVKKLTLLLGQDRMNAKVFDLAAEKYGIKLDKVGIPREAGGVSGTATRLAAGNKDWKTFFSLVAPGASQATKREVFKELQAGMGSKKFNMGGMIPGYANGVFSVPGPKGAGDVVPAMLSPGEAVIPAKQAGQHRGLITQMIAGKLPGYNKGTSGVPGYFDGIPGVPKPPSVPSSEPSSGGLKGVLSSLTDSAKKFADAAVTTSKQAATVVGTKAKQAGKAILDSDAAVGFAEHLSGGGVGIKDSKGVVRNQKKLDAEAAEKKAIADQNRQRADAARKQLEANDIEYQASQKRVQQLQEKIESGKKLTKAEEEDLKKQKQLLLDKRALVREQIKQTQIEDGSLKRLSAQKGTPEYKEQQKELRAKRNEPYAKISGKMGQIGMTAGMAAGALSMIPGPLGQIAGQASGAIAGLGMLTQFINGPLSGGIVAAVAVFGAMYMAIDGLNNKFKESVLSAQKSKEAIGASTKAIRALSEFNKKVTAGELMDKVRANKLVGINTAAGKTTFGESYVKSEQGTAFMKDLKEKVKQEKGVTDGIIADYANQLSTAVASGAINAEQAASIAANVGAALGDTNFAFKVRAQVGEIIGPNGENLQKDPITIAAIIQGRSIEQIESSKMNLQKATQQNRLWSGGENNETNRNVTAAGTVLASAGSGAAIGTGIGAAIGSILPGVGTAIGAGLGAIIGTIGGAIGGYFASTATLTEQAAQAGRMAGAMIGDMNIALQQQKEMADILDRYYMKKLDEAKAEGNVTEQKRLQLEYDEKKNKLAEINKGLTTAIVDTYNSADGTTQEALRTGAQTAIDAKYKDSPDQLMYLEVIKQGLDKATSDNNITGGDKMLLQTEMISGNLLPSDMSKLIALMSDKDMSTKVMNIVTNYGATTATQFAQTMGMIKDEAVQKEVALAVSTAGSAADALEILDLVQKVEQLGGVISADVIVSYFQKNDAVADKTIGLLQKFEQQGNKLNAKVAMTIDTTIQEGENFDKDYFDKLKTKDKVQYLQVVESIIQVAPSVIESTPDFQRWLNDEGAKLGTYPGNNSNKWWVGQYAMQRAYKVTTETPASALDTPAATGPKKQAEGPKASFLDPYVESLRNASNWQQKLTVGFEASLKALRGQEGALTKFAGLAVRLKSSGADANFIQAVLGGSPEDIDKVINRATGKLTKAGEDAIRIAKKVENAKIGMAYILAGPIGRLEKDNELYNAGLEVISIKEKKINDKYDKRIKALDQIGKLQERNNQKQQDSLTLADALSKGDIAAAARAAMAMRQNSQKQALDDAKTSVENARKNELEAITVKILGQTVTRDELEARIATNSEKIAISKKNELDTQIKIGKNAVITANAVAKTLAAGQKIVGLKSSIGGGTTSTSSTSTKDDPKEEEEKPKTIATTAGKAISGLAKTAQFGAGLDARTKVYKAQSMTELSVSGVAAKKQSLADKAYDLKSEGARLKYLTSDGAVQDRSKVTNQAAFDVWLAKYNAANSEVSGFASKVKTDKAKIFSELPKEVQVALESIKSYNEQKKEANAEVKAAKETFNAAAEKQIGKDSNGNWKDIGPGGLNEKLYKQLYAPVAAALAKSTGISQSIRGIDTSLSSKGYTPSMTEFYVGKRYNMGGMVYAQNGMHIAKSKYALGTDTIPAMLTPGEFVMRKAAVDSIGADKLMAMNNNGTSIGESVYNYSITVNATGNFDSNDLARKVMEQIKQVDSQRMRSNNY